MRGTNLVTKLNNIKAWIKLILTAAQPRLSMPRKQLMGPLPVSGLYQSGAGLSEHRHSLMVRKKQAGG